MDFLIITNNPQVQEAYGYLPVDFVAGSVGDVYLKVRNLVHRGHRILTHPLSGSLKPGRIPYKTVFVSKQKAQTELHSLQLVEASIATWEKTRTPVPLNWPPQILADYSLIDLDHAKAALESLLEG